MRYSTPSIILYRVRCGHAGLYYHSGVPSWRHWQRAGKFYSKQALAQIERALADAEPGLGYEVERWSAYPEGRET